MALVQAVAVEDLQLPTEETHLREKPSTAAVAAAVDVAGDSPQSAEAAHSREMLPPGPMPNW